MDIGLKDAIAQEAVKYVAPGDVIAIGGGTTAYVFAQHLLESQQSSGITILTNSIPVAELVQALESKDVEVIVTGGVITRSNSLVGPIADKVVASADSTCSTTSAPTCSTTWTTADRKSTRLNSSHRL